jgi:chromosomal replication initiation ATPase DnaA
MISPQIKLFETARRQPGHSPNPVGRGVLNAMKSRLERVFQNIVYKRLGEGYTIKIEKTGGLRANEILDNVCKALGYPKDSVISKSRKREYVFARSIAVYYILKETKLADKTIGLVIGSRDRTTVINCRQTHDDMVFSRDKQYMEYLNKCEDHGI